MHGRTYYLLCRVGGRSGYITGARGADLQRGKVHLLFRVLEEFRDETSQMFLQAFFCSINWAAALYN